MIADEKKMRWLLIRKKWDDLVVITKFYSLPYGIQKWPCKVGFHTFSFNFTVVFLWNWTKPILPFKMGIFSQGFWALKVLPPPWPPGSKQYEIGGFQKSITCPRCFHMTIWYIHKKNNFWKMKKVWQPATFQPLEALGQVVPFWKLPISHCLDPGGHRRERTFGAQKP